MPFAAHPGVQGEAIGPGYPLQSGIRSVQGAEGADHEGFLDLLRIDCDAAGDGTAQNQWQGIGLPGGVEFQPGAFCVLYKQALALQAAADTRAYPLTSSSNSPLYGALTR